MRLVAFVVALVALAGSACAEPRIALVIGNSNYGSDLGHLRNPANDARLMANTLRGIGFEVVEAEDADQTKMKRTIQEFGARLAEAGQGATGLFYYAGHGVQVAGTNYLVPIHARIGREADVDIEAVPVDLIMKQMAFAETGVSIVILDACRNNPLSRGFRSVTRGLADPAVRPMGSFIAYSTAPGDVAEDGNGANSPYTMALAAAITKPGVSINDVFQQVRGEVLAATDRKQVPWDSSSLTAPFYFVPAAKAAEPDPVELAFWDAIKDSKLADDYRAYLGRYPEGAFAPLAQVRLKQLDPQTAGASDPDSVAAAGTDAGESRSASIESAFWEGVEADRSAEGYRAYLKNFPDGRFAERARVRLAELDDPAASVAAASPPYAPTPPVPDDASTYITLPGFSDHDACFQDVGASGEQIVDSCGRLLAAGLADDTERYNAHFYRGNALFALGRDDEALQNYQAAIDIDPEFFGAHHWVGRVLLRKQRYKEAQAAFDKAIALDSTRWWPVLYRGATLRRLGQTDAALDDIERAIALDSEAVEAYHERSFVHLARGELAAAMEDIGRALKIDPASWAPSGFFSLYLSGRPAEAIAMAERAVANTADPFHWQIWKAMAERKTGAAATAGSTLQAARGSADGDEWRLALLDYLEGRISESEARARARTATQIAELDFYGAERAVLADDPAAARAMLRRVAESGLYDMVEYSVAPAWIAELGGS